MLSEFGSDGLSQPNDDGSFSTSWLMNLTAATGTWPKNLHKAKRSSVNDYDIFHFGSQPNPIPTSVLQLAGSSYLLRATSWELYGRYSHRPFQLVLFRRQHQYLPIEQRKIDPSDLKAIDSMCIGLHVQSTGFQPLICAY